MKIKRLPKFTLCLGDERRRDEVGAETKRGAEHIGIEIELEENLPASFNVRSRLFFGFILTWLNDIM